MQPWRCARALAASSASWLDAVLSTPLTMLPVSVLCAYEEGGVRTWLSQARWSEQSVSMHSCNWRLSIALS